MKSIWFAGMSVAATLVCAAPPLLAQEEGKTKAAELQSTSQKALTKLYTSAPLAKQLAPKAEAILIFPKVTKAGFVVGGQYGEGTLLKGDGGRLLQDDGSFFRAAGRGPGVRVRHVLHEREGARSA